MYKGLPVAMALRRSRLQLGAAIISLGLLTSSLHAQPREEIVKNPYYGQALFHFYQQKYFSSINELLVAKQIRPIKEQGNNPELLLGGLYLAYGLHGQAADIFREMTKDDLAQETRDRAWFYLAKMNYLNSNYGKAEEALKKISADIPEHYLAEQQHLLSNIYLKTRRYDEAITILSDFEGDAIWETYARYNLGIALVHQDRAEDGLNLLKKVGDIKLLNSPEEILSVRDKANVALGFHLIREKRAQDAVEVFRRVRMQGPLSNKALLGLGWAYSELQQYQTALTPWYELKQRASFDPAVQESLLAIPFTQEQLTQKQTALSNYNAAINSLNKELNTIKKVIAAAKQGEFVRAIRPGTLSDETGVSQSYRPMPDSIAAPYLLELLAQNDFQEAMHTYHDLLYLRYTLNYWSQQFKAYDLMLSERKRAYHAKLPRVTRDERLIKLPQLQTQRDELATQIARIERSQDALALATEEEQDLLDQLNKLKQRLARVSKPDDANEERTKVRLLYGILYWQISTDYAPRLWLAKRNLKELDQALQKANSAKQSLARAWQQAPRTFEGFEDRIAGQRARHARLLQQIENVIAQHESYLTNLTVNALNQRYRQLENYHIRASYSLTRLYDSLAQDEAKP